MNEKEINLFVPGRLCILGEHSDWAGAYRKNNNELEKGYVIVTGIEQGIYAKCKISDKFLIKFDKNKDKYFECEMNLNKLLKVAESGEFFSYVSGVAYCIKEQYNVGGIEITILDETVPIKKGLSSSAAICVLVTRAFNQLYNLHLNTIDEMNMAYLGEITTPSRCGKLDQACAFGTRPILMTFDGDKFSIKNIKVGNDLHFVFADLMSGKDTIKILADLNKCYPFATNTQEENVQKCLGEINKENIKKSVKYIEDGDIEKLGKMLTKAQNDFDKYVAPKCLKELKSPKLHKVLKDEYIKTLSYGGKGVGSQGDGSVQFLAKDKKSQLKIKKYLEKLGMIVYTLTIEKTKPITKAIIPVAGNGSRMFPMTKMLRKCFLPIVDKDGLLKPALMCILEELDEAGIEEICLVIDEQDQKDYDKFFNQGLTENLKVRLSREMLNYEAKIHKIGKKIKYIYQDEKLGLGHAVSLCEEFAGNNQVLLVLGDQLYKTRNSKSCTKQLIENYETTNKMTIAVEEISLEEVSKYGILTGKIDKNENYFSVDKITEKPDISYAKDFLYTLNENNTKKKYYCVFGEYIITKAVFEKLKQDVKNNNKVYGEIQLTSALEYVRKREGMNAFIVDGEMLDIGNVEGYKDAFMKMKGNISNER